MVMDNLDKALNLFLRALMGLHLQLRGTKLGHHGINIQ
jgi:hypothetical protein